MIGKRDILFSGYIIDGVAKESTPADMLRDCMPAQAWDRCSRNWPEDGGEQNQDTSDRMSGTIIDETADRVPVNFRYDQSKVFDYLDSIEKTVHSGAGLPVCIDRDHPFSNTRIAIAECILEALWREGHFNLPNLDISACWTWDPSPVGNMAAFYDSVEAATGYIYDLGVKLTGVDIDTVRGKHEAVFGISDVRNWLPFNEDSSADIPEDRIMEDSDESGTDYEETQEKVWIWNSRKCPDNIISSGNCGSTLIYIPFDTCTHRLGGSFLSKILGEGNENGPEIMDPDYFIDCFEVVRELVEDGIVLSGVTAGRGGLIEAVSKIVSDGSVELDISGIEQAYIETDAVRILFAEIPGVVIQIKDDDYDYVDAQLLLQDIAYYPIGHPGNGAESSGRHIRLNSVSRNGLSAILASLMDGQSYEGED